MINTKALVYKKGVLAASLTKDNGQTKFQYENSYLFAAGPAVATTLPLTSEPLIIANGATPAFFAGLLPEGRRLGALVKRLKTSPDDDLGLLLEIGADLIGDVQVLREGSSTDEGRDLLSLPGDLGEVSFAALREEYFGARATGLPGVQDKISSKMMNARARFANVDYILKLNPVDVPFAVENEVFFLTLAKKCGIPTAKFKVLRDKNGESALRLERFDRVVLDEGKVRLAQEDGCQAMNLYPGDKGNVDFLEMAQKLISLCSARGVAGYSLFKQLVFIWLIGNGDAHAKNFSILEGQLGEWTISPAYDLLCTRFYEDRESREMTLAIKGVSSDWNREFLPESAREMRVPRLAAEKIIDNQLKVLAALPDQIIDGALPFERHLNYDVGAFLKKRARALHP